MFGKKELEEELEKCREEIEEYEEKTESLEKKLEKRREKTRRILKKLLGLLIDEEEIPKERKKIYTKLKDELASLKNDFEGTLREKEHIEKKLSELESQPSIEGKNDVVIPKNTAVNGGIETEGAIDIRENSSIDGAVVGGDEVELGDDVEVTADLVSEAGNVEIGAGCTIKGTVKGESVTLGEGTSVTKIVSRGDVSMGKNAQTKKITAINDVNMQSGSAVERDIKYAGKFTSDSTIEVKGSLEPCDEEEIKKVMVSGKKKASRDRNDKEKEDVEDENEKESADEGERKEGMEIDGKDIVDRASIVNAKGD